MSKLPVEIQREVNCLAHALAQWSYTGHRQRLQAEAYALLRAGHDSQGVIVQLQQVTAKAGAGR